MESLTDSNIKEFLENMPLYSWKEFKSPIKDRSSLWIHEIDAYCETCKQKRPFQDRRSRGGGAGMPTKLLSTGQSYFEFTCVSCSKDRHEYLVNQIVTDETIKIQKYGELPRKSLDRDAILQKFFSKDSDYYEKAVMCLAHGYGIAAFAYMRRIIENNISELLDMIQEEIKSTDDNSSLLTKLSELKEKTPMSDKIKIANTALPEYLTPSGLNPLGKLYQILSAGIHSDSDESCLNKAKTLQECIKYLISELSSRKKNRESFKNLVGSL